MDKIEIANYIIENEKIPKEFDNYVILQISDLHNKSFGKKSQMLCSYMLKFNFKADSKSLNYLNGQCFSLKICNFM